MLHYPEDPGCSQQQLPLVPLEWAATNYTVQPSLLCPPLTRTSPIIPSTAENIVSAQISPVCGVPPTWLSGPVASARQKVAEMGYGGQKD